MPNSVVLVFGAIAAQLSATMPNAMQDLMALLANADQAQYDSGAGVLTVQSGERKLRLVWIAGLLQLLGLL